jgi:hypothetical protein
VRRAYLGGGTTSSNAVLDVVEGVDPVQRVDHGHPKPTKSPKEQS